MTGLDHHPAADSFPLMTSQRYEELRLDIARQGQLEPITLCDGMILDGRNRYRACIELGIEPRTRLYEGDPWAYAWSLNGERRDLVDEQRYLIWKHCNEHSKAWLAQKQAIAEEANRKRSEAAQGNRNSAQAYICSVCGDIFDIGDLGHCPVCDHHYHAGSECGNCHERVIRKTMRKAGFTYGEWAEKQKKNSAGTECSPTVSRHPERKAKAVASKTNPGAVARGDKLVKDRPDLAEQVRKGDIKPAEAHRQMKKDEVKGKAAELPKDKFSVIYADPPWSYNDKQGGSISESYGAAEKHYPSLSLSELKALPIRDLSADDCVLFLWATCPLLEDALELCRAWGFRYKAQFVWDKVRHNMGHYNSVRHELLLICTKGSATPQNVKLHDSVQVIEKTNKHSEKPERFREIIDELYPVGNRIELFRRGSTPKGWSAWGNESH